MRSRFCAFGLFLVVLCVIPVSAQRVATKDGKVIQFKNYRVTEEALLYTDDAGKEVSIPLKNIDLDHTQELNAQEISPLILPGMAASPKNASVAPSLGEVARKTRSSEKPSTTKHAFTDDDVSHSSGPSGDVPIPSPEDSRTRMGKAQKAVDEWAGKTARQVSDSIVGQNQFPGRDSWEQKLYQQKEKLISAAQDCLNAANRITNAATKDERHAAQESAEKFLWDFDRESSLYKNLVAEGVKKAGDWQRYHH